MSDIRFEEKILYKVHQHWMVPLIQSLKLLIFIIIPITVVLYFASNYSLLWTTVGCVIISIIVLGYEHYLWHHSWLMVGNQKVTLSVRNGLFSQYAMNIRYRNIRDCAVSKNSILGFLFKYGTLFIRSSSAEGDFSAYYVPKVGKIYALVNALSRYSDDERASMHSIEALYNFHSKTEFPGTVSQTDMIQKNTDHVRALAGVTEVVILSPDARAYIASNEEIRNHGVYEVLRRKHILCFLHDIEFRSAAGPLTQKTATGEVYFPGVPFPEVEGKDVISASPGSAVHAYLLQFFPYATESEATVLVGWNE